KVRPRNPRWESKVVLYPRTRTRLTPRSLGFNHQRLQPLTGAVDRCRKTGRPGADYHHVVELLGGMGAQSYLRRHRIRICIGEGAPVREENHRQLVGLQFALAEKLLTLFGCSGIDPAVGHMVAGEEIAEVMVSKRPSVSDYPQTFEWRVISSF